MPVEVILRDDVQHLGKIGEVVRVKPGFARNFLFPRGLAVEANPKNLKVLEHTKRVIAVKAERENKEAAAVAARVEGTAIRIQARAGEDGRLFGSVTNIDVERLLAEKGVQVDRRKIALAEPIKALGTFPIEVQLGRGVKATIQLTVEAAPE
jgi:large subunit ribosomal protein L9